MSLQGRETMQHPQWWSAVIENIILSSQDANPRVEHLPHNIWYAFSYIDSALSPLLCNIKILTIWSLKAIFNRLHNCWSPANPTVGLDLDQHL